MRGCNMWLICPETPNLDAFIQNQCFEVGSMSDIGNNSDSRAQYSLKTMEECADKCGSVAHTRSRGSQTCTSTDKQTLQRHPDCRSDECMLMRL